MHEAMSMDYLVDPNGDLNYPERIDVQADGVDVVGG